MEKDTDKNKEGHMVTWFIKEEKENTSIEKTIFPDCLSGLSGLSFFLKTQD